MEEKPAIQNKEKKKCCCTFCDSVNRDMKEFYMVRIEGN